MRRRLTSCLLIAAVLAVTGCAGAAGDVSVLQHPSIAIQPGSTFAWQALTEQEQQTGDPRIDNDIIRARLRSAVESALAGRGYRLVSDPAAAQLLVSYHVGLEARTDYRVDTLSAGPVACGWRGCIGGYGWGMYGAPTDVRAVHYTEGTVILDLTERASGTLAWRATSQRRVDAGDRSQETLNAIVADMVKTLPAATPGS